MPESYYVKAGLFLQDVVLNNQEKEKVKWLLNRKFKHTDEQVNRICATINAVLTDQPVYDTEYQLPRQWTAKEIVTQLEKLEGHLALAQKIIHEEFGLHVEGLIEQHYLLNTRRFLPNDFQQTDRGPVEDILYRLANAVSDTISHDLKELSETKEKPKTASGQYYHLIYELARVCLDAQVKFKLKHKAGTPFYRLIEWVIKEKIGDNKRSSLERQIQGVLAKIQENTPCNSGG